MIVGTSGHVDHGKTSLVKALTGVDTDRLKEEKARGISIELGYAYRLLPDGGVLGFVDVPGHERFVDHMVAGATGIDFVVLVVAADDGPMPQTVEHLDIVALLGVREGAIAVTKVDRVDSARRAECEREIRALVAAGPLGEVPVFHVSSVTGEGVGELHSHLVAVASKARAARPGAGFRLAVDRCFTLEGVGTVVTGTAFAGRVSVGEEVVVTPSGHRARVRSLHAQNRSAPAGRGGERCALALAGLSKDHVQRGDWIVAPHLHMPTSRLDARIAVSARESKSLRHWTPAHFHLGAAHLLARVALLEGDSLSPGASALAQIVTERPIGALAGDSFVLRDASGARTLGGGRVLDPLGRDRHRRTAERIDVLERLDRAAPQERLRALLQVSETGVDLARFAAAQNADPASLDAGEGAVLVRAGATEVLVGRSSWSAMQERFVARLAACHEERPDELGPDLGRMRRMSFARHEPAVVEAVADALLSEGRIARSGPWWHLPDHSIRLTEREELLAQKILPRLDEEGYDPSWVRDLGKAYCAPEHEVRALMGRLGRRGEVFPIVKDLFYSRSAVARLARIAQSLDAERGAVRAADFRDRVGVGRKRAIQILEFFDRVGFTRRARDAHRVRGDNLLRLEETA